MKINFYLNQINDPIYGSSFLAWCFEKINKRFHPTEPPKFVPENSFVRLLIDDDSDLFEVNSDLSDAEDEPVPVIRESFCQRWCSYFYRKNETHQNKNTVSLDVRKYRS